MAVYTIVGHSELARALRAFGLALSHGPNGVDDGIENTTYFFSATDSEGVSHSYVLTVLENCPREQIIFSSGLASHLGQAGLPVPQPLGDERGESILTIADKPALIFPRIDGSHLSQVTESDAHAIGRFLAEAHLAGASYPREHANLRGLPWLNNAKKVLEANLGIGDAVLLQEQVQRYAKFSATTSQLPTGAIHGDLFRDNALFSQGELVAVFDYFNACTDWLLLDVAIALNDWCGISHRDGIDRDLADALLLGYSGVRPFTREERQHWQDILCFACCRFWVSRLLALYSPEALGGSMRAKSPDEYRTHLLQRVVTYPPLPK